MRSAPLTGDGAATRAWEPLRPGIEIRVLYEDSASAQRIALLRYQPGARVPSHQHVGEEHIYVLEGAQQDENGRYPAGSYQCNTPGTVHSVYSPEGCLVLIHWTGPLDFSVEADGASPDAAES